MCRLSHSRQFCSVSCLLLPTLTSLSLRFYLTLSLILSLILCNRVNIGGFNLSIDFLRAVVFTFALGISVSISTCFVLVLI